MLTTIPPTPHQKKKTFYLAVWEAASPDIKAYVGQGQPMTALPLCTQRARWGNSGFYNRPSLKNYKV
jgi:hypothetical protein